MFRKIQGDDTLGGMIICETGTQAKKIYELFNEIQQELNESEYIKSDLKIGLILISISSIKQESGNIIVVKLPHIV